MYIGAILPWDEFNQPEVTGITYPRLVALGFLVLLLRRLPAIFMTYRFMSGVCKNWKEALFMGYYGPIGKIDFPCAVITEIRRLIVATDVGAGAVFYLEHARHLFPKLGEGDTEETNLIRALGPSK
jgi:NhaP-type Na+/H+ or K+/H+ antiporter